MPPNEGKIAPRRGLGPWMATALVVGNMIGAGVFLLPASLAEYGGISLFGWVFTATGAVLLALVFARLGRVVPRVGGPYAYTRLGFGDYPGFLVAWGYWISIWVGNAGIAVAFAGYLSPFWPAIAESRLLTSAIALAAVWLLTGVNAAGVREGGFVQLVTTLLKLVPLVAIGVIGLFFLDPAHFTPLNRSEGSSFAALSAAAALTLWAFSGLESATVPAEHVIDPNRTIPRATIIGTLLAAVVYVAATAAVMGQLPPAELAVSGAPFADAARALWGSWAAYGVAAGAAISAFGALNGWILLQGQIPLAAARDGLFPTGFARLSSQETPVFGLIVSSLLITALMTANSSRALVELFTFTVLLSTISTLVPYLFTSMAALMIDGPARDDAERTGRPRISTTVAILAFVYSLWAIGGTGRDAVFWGFLLLLAGTPVYVWIRRRSAAGGR